MENKDTFTDLWKNVQLQERIGKTHPQGRADDIRNVLVQIQTARANKILDNISCNSLYLKEADKYAELTDSPEEQGGLNNHAENILTLLQGKRNESSQWKSSLSLSNIADMDCIKRYKDICKAAKSTLVPVGQEQSSIPFTKDSAVSDPKPSNKNTNFPPGNTMFAPQQSTPREPSIPSKASFSHQNNNTRQSQGFVPAQSILQCVGQKKPNLNNVDKYQSNGLFSKHHSNADNGNSENNEFWKVGTECNSIKQFRDNGNNFQSNSSYYTERADDFSTSRYKEVSNKRTREIDEEDNMSSGPTVGAPMFRTARQQLAIDNQKKYGSKSKSHGSVNNAAYGTAKKSLGTRRGLNSKFVPPVMNRDEEDSDSGTLVQRAGPHKGSKIETGNGEEVDERLKNIEPKMVELIMSEIMDQGKLLTWNDIAGLEFAKKTIQEIVVWPMLRPDIFTGLRGPPKGLLLFGPPGTGKTLIGKCIASQSKSTFFSISASSLTSKWVGEGEKMVRALFAVARVHQPAVVFIDEIDSLLSQRSDTEHESSRRIKTEFLVQLDGATTGETDRILVIGATNRPQEIDEAARRRFVKRLYIPLPEAAARKQIIHNLMVEQSHHLEDNELEAVLEKSQGYSGADMANLCREAALGPIRSIPLSDIENITADQVRPILYEDFEQALKQVRASVSEKDLDLYLDWNKQYGSWGM